MLMVVWKSMVPSAPKMDPTIDEYLRISDDVISREPTSAESERTRVPHREDTDGLRRLPPFYGWVASPPLLKGGLKQPISVLEQILG